MADTIRDGVEAIVIDDIAFWNKKQLAILKSKNWNKAQTPVILKKGTKVFVLDSQNDTAFTKVMTLINIDGYIASEYLKFNSLTPDSSIYFTNRNIKYLRSSVDGIDIKDVNLWDNKTERNNVVGKIYINIPFAVLKNEDEYVKIMNISGDTGWCMKGFLK